MNAPFVNLLVRWLVLALGVGLAATIVPGISYDSGGTLVLVVLLLSVANAFLKPLLVLFTLPFIVLTLGLGVWLINALLLLFVGWLLDGFRVAGFGSALLGALVVSLVNLAVTKLLRDSARPPPPPPRRGRDDDVIDV